jgi:voltage-gated potassium channel
VIFLLRWLSLGHRRHVVLLLGSVVAVVVAGGAVFAATQHLPLTTGWYWAITTATTVGYGDVTPKNPSGRIVASVVMLTAIPALGAAFALATGSVVLERLRRMLSMEAHVPAGSFHLVVGTPAASDAILEELVRAGEDVVVVADLDPASLPAGVRLVRGDPTSAAAIRAAHPERAADALVAGASDGDVLVAVILLHEHAPGLPVTALASSARVGEALRELGVAHIVSTELLVAHTVAKSLEAPHAGELLLRLLDSEGNRLVEETVGDGAAPRPLSALRAERGELLLGVVQQGAVSLGVGDDPEVRPGDVLLVVEPVRTADRGPQRKAGLRRR